MLRAWFGSPLWKRVVVALLLGIATGFAVGEDIVAIKWIGDLFIRLIKMLVVPLIFFSLVGGVAALGDIRKLGSVGGRAMGLFVGTAIISVTIGMVLATLVAPGAGLVIVLPPGTALPPPPDQSLVEMIISIVPENPIMSMAEGQILPVIVFAVMFGMALLMTGEEASPLVRGIDAVSAVMQRLTIIVMEFTPLGVFALMAWVAGTFWFDALIPLSKLVMLNYLGCGIILLVVYPAILRYLAKLPTIDFYRGIVDAQAVAFSTASSNATLPVTLRCVQRNLGVNPSFTITALAEYAMSKIPIKGDADSDPH